MRLRRVFLGERDIYVPEQVVIGGGEDAPTPSSGLKWILAGLAALAFWKG